MDLVKIGSYIAGKRKELGMTQRELAEKLRMSDKSVSKWERGVCLPDVSVYSELCTILGITINEFIAGEDIGKDNIVQKAEQNIIGVTINNKQKLNKMKIIICILLVAAFLATGWLVTFLYRSILPQNYFIAEDKNSDEMKAVEMLAGADGAFMYKYVTTDTYSTIKLLLSEYQFGKLVKKETIELSCEGINSSDSGTMLIVPDFDRYLIRLIIANDSSKYSTERPILENVEDRQYFGRSASSIENKTDIAWGEEQPLLALIYDSDDMHVPKLQDLVNGQTDLLSENDYIYFFSIQFCK